MITPALLDRLTELHDAAGFAHPLKVTPGWDLAVVHGSGEATPFTAADAALIVAAVNAAPALVAKIREQEARLRAAQVLVTELEHEKGSTQGNVARLLVASRLHRILTGPPDGFCTCVPGVPMRDCGIAVHRTAARHLRALAGGGEVDR